MEGKKGVHVVYRGTVQGVGFRYTVRQIAEGLGVNGWVKNLWDGSVEVEAEGEEYTLKRFLGEIGEHFSGYIRGADVSWEPSTDSFKGFTVKF
ncbi:MAG: acylphosphatase [Deltaproteobacteria bacterium]